MEDIIDAIGDEVLPSQAKPLYTTLHKVFGNIIKNPGEAKFRSLGKDKKLVAEVIGKSKNAISLLLATGFEDTGATYTLSPGMPLDALQTAHDLLEGILESFPAEEAAPVAAPVSQAAAAPLAVPSAAKATKPQEGQFARRSDVEKQRAAEAGQLQAIRAERKEKVDQAGGYAAAAAAPVANGGYAGPAASGTFAPPVADAKRKPIAPKSAFDFKNRSEEERRAREAQESLQELRKAQKDKFKDFQQNPEAQAAQAQAYKQPPSVANGGKKEDSSWFGGWFGGSSSSGGGGPDRDDRRPPGPRIKGMGDLPKPVQRGGG